MIKKSIILFVFVCFSLNAKVTIIHNVNGYSINQHELTLFNAIAFEYESILKIGNKEALIEFYPDNNLIDGKGNTMLPGIHDSRVNILQAAKNSDQVDLRGAKSLKNTLELIKKYHESHPNKRWIIGYGWDQNKWSNNELPTRWDLDRLKTQKPIWLLNEDKTIGWASTRAMQQAKVFKNKQLQSNQVTWDKKGKPKGIFFGTAINIIQRQIHKNKSFHLVHSSNNILNRLPRYGITGINDNNISNQSFNTYKNLNKRRKIPLRVNASITSAEKNFHRLLGDGPYHYKNQFLHIHSSSYYIDDEIKFHKALLFKPYHDDKSLTGLIRQSEDFLKQELIDRSNQGWQLNLNAFGDKATHIALGLLNNKEAKTKEIRHQINNATLIRKEDLTLLNQNNITVSIQPNQAIAEFGKLVNLVGKQRSHQAHIWQSMIKNGANLISGSNYPQSNINPFYGIHAAVTRQYRNNQPTNGWNTDEKLTVKQALASYTTNPAYANRQELSLGSLETGKLADFILIDQNIFTINPQDIWKTKVLQTWIAGNKVYDLIEDNQKKKEKEEIFKASLEK